MINKVILNNFQSHSKSELEFVQGVNVIIGKSDSGKSAIMRAIRWIIKNRPLGNSFITKGTNESRVELETDQHVIERFRNKKNNHYTLVEKEDIEGEYFQIYKAASGGVPEPVEEVLNFGDINLQGQIDQPFLLFNSPGEVASYFNSIVDLSKSDTMISNIDRKRKDAIKKADFYFEEMAEKKKELDGFIDVKYLEALVDEVEEKENGIQEKVFAINRIDTLIFQITEKQKLIERMPDTSAAEQKLNTLEDVMGKLSDKQDKFIELDKTIKRIISLDSALIKSINKLEKLEMKLKKIMPEICPVCKQKIKKESIK